METRRQWLGKVLATGTVVFCGCGSTESEMTPPSSPTPAAVGSTRPQPWEPVDPAFTGCGGG